MDFSAILPTLVVTLRDGFEATLIVGIVFTCLQRAEKQEYYRWIVLGVIAGILTSILLGVVIWQSLAGIESSTYVYAPVIKKLLKTVFVVIAVVTLSWMLIWMGKQAQSMQGEVKKNIKEALEDDDRNTSLAIFLLVFFAVVREGFEVVIFINAQVQSNPINAAIGSFIGLCIAAFMGWLLFYWGIKINIRLFFKVMGIFLLLIVSGLVVSAFKNFDEAVTLLTQINSNYESLCLFDRGSCLLGFPIWDASNVLPDSQFPGILLKTFFGYRDHLYLLQLVAYTLFITLVGNFYLNSLKSEN